ncbi:hypothetical protein ANN_19021 [Periplaneta americana]|uniref:DUF4817 domain-containing protein n=1 Tax=Periplaneta americana TaxID=6978 RepID=A0ABQ8SQC0_PERAM|nr:hypothetical protein ANN_19021 [Periplaneta americana]
MQPANHPKLESKPRWSAAPDQQTNSPPPVLLCVQFKVCHCSLYVVMWLVDEPREFNLPTLPQRRITYVPEKLPSKYGVHSEEYLPIRTGSSPESDEASLSIQYPHTSQTSPKSIEVCGLNDYPAEIEEFQHDTDILPLRARMIAYLWSHRVPGGRYTRVGPSFVVEKSLMLAGSEFQSLGRAIVKEDEYEEVRWDASDDNFVKYESWRTVITNFRQSFPDSPEPSKAMIYNLVKKFRTAGSVLDKKRICVKRVLTEILDEIGHRLERSSTSSCRVAQQAPSIKSSSIILIPSEDVRSGNEGCHTAGKRASRFAPGCESSEEMEAADVPEMTRKMCWSNKTLKRSNTHLRGSSKKHNLTLLRSV